MLRKQLPYHFVREGIGHFSFRIQRLQLIDLTFRQGLLIVSEMVIDVVVENHDGPS